MNDPQTRPCRRHGFLWSVKRGDAHNVTSRLTSTLNISRYLVIDTGRPFNLIPSTMCELRASTTLCSRELIADKLRPSGLGMMCIPTNDKGWGMQ